VGCVQVEVGESPAGVTVGSAFAVENRPNTREVRLMAVSRRSAAPELVGTRLGIRGAERLDGRGAPLGDKNNKKE